MSPSAGLVDEVVDSACNHEEKHPEAIDAPIFLVGAVRSGTTLLTLMLAHHPEIAFPGEFELSVDQIAQDGTWPELPAYHDWLRTNRHFLWHRLRIDAALDYRSLVRSFLGQMKQERGGYAKPFVGAAIHWKFENLPGLWPDARYIHLLRDPRDVAASIIEEGWAGNHYIAARTWYECESAWADLSSRVPAERYTEVRFEELTAQPRETLERICAFIGVPYHEAMLRYPDDTTYGHVDSSVAERWRQNQTRREIQLAEAGVEDLLEKRGYEASGAPPLQINRLRASWLSLLSRAQTLQFRLKRYGINLWIQRRLSQALRMRAWHERVVLRHHDILNRHIK